MSTNDYPEIRYMKAFCEALSQKTPYDSLEWSLRPSNEPGDLSFEVLSAPIQLKKGYIRLQTSHVVRGPSITADEDVTPTSPFTFTPLLFNAYITYESSTIFRRNGHHTVNPQLQWMLGDQAVFERGSYMYGPAKEAFDEIKEQYLKPAALATSIEKIDDLFAKNPERKREHV